MEPPLSQRDVPGRQEYVRRWAALHGVDDPAATPFVAGWLRIAHTCAVPAVRVGVSPNALTAVGLLLALAVLPVVALGGRWPLLAPVLVVASAMLDSLDGAVAVMAGRTSRWGALLDALADRVSDSAYLAALWLLGAPAWLAVAAGAVALLHEYARARATSAGMDDVGAVTVSERPTRVVIATMFVLAAGLYPSAAATWGGLGAAAALVVGLVGLVQLLVVVRRRLRTGS